MKLKKRMRRNTFSRMKLKKTKHGNITTFPRTRHFNRMTKKRKRHLSLVGSL
jgi:hypothetical protein